MSDDLDPIELAAVRVKRELDATPRDEADADTEYAFILDVEREAHRLRVRDAAAEKVAAERDAATPRAPLDFDTLAGVWQRPPLPPMRVDGLIPSQSSTLIVAAYKTGKTTLVLNLAHSLLSGEPFLDRFNVRKVDGNVAMLNYEVDSAMFGRWAKQVGIDGDRMGVASLRGTNRPLDAELADKLRAFGVETLIVDPFSRAFTGTNQNDAGEVSRWLADLEVFAREQVGASDLILTTHAGWNAERTRGSSALGDWADVLMHLTRDDTGHRYLSAVGRDVEVEEDQLIYYDGNRHLSMTGFGSRKASAKQRHVSELVATVAAIVEQERGITGYRVQQVLRDRKVPFQKGDETKALSVAVEQGALRFERGPRNAKQYFAT